MLDIVHRRDKLQCDIHAGLFFIISRCLHQIAVQLLVSIPQSQRFLLHVLPGLRRLLLLLMIRKSHLAHLRKYKQNHQNGDGSAINRMSHVCKILTFHQSPFKLRNHFIYMVLCDDKGRNQTQHVASGCDHNQTLIHRF